MLHPVVSLSPSQGREGGVGGGGELGGGKGKGGRGEGGRGGGRENEQHIR